MREPEIVLVRVQGVALALCMLGAGACKSEAPADGPPERDGPKPGPASSEVEPHSNPNAIPDDPDRADKLADLDAMCKALDRDYEDGTLTDYYRDVRPRTAWGKAQRDAGNESIQPGRLLEKAVAELSLDAKDPALGSCHTLLDYLDDVE